MFQDELDSYKSLQHSLAEALDLLITINNENIKLRKDSGARPVPIGPKLKKMQQSLSQSRIVLSNSMKRTTM